MVMLRALSLWLLVSPAVAGPYTDLIVFGDSLSDVGNRFEISGGNQPAPPYYEGRFSNGPLFVERLAEGLGLDPLVHRLDGGAGYAFGGAETDGSSGDASTDSLIEQVDAYLEDLGGAPADPDALHVVLIGGNDLLAGETNVTTPAVTVQVQLARLADAGARQFLGVNLTRLGLTPNQLGNDSLSTLTVAYNDALDSAYTAFESLYPEATLHRFDMQALSDQVVANPEWYGFTNITGRGLGAADPAGYLFWDGVHPTAEAHALFGEAALRAVLPTGDFDRDGLVTAADYAVWSASRGALFNAAAGLTTGIEADANGDGRVDAADYAVWREQQAGTTGSIPEPGGATLMAALAVSAAARSERRAIGRFRSPANR